MPQSRAFRFPLLAAIVLLCLAIPISLGAQVVVDPGEYLETSRAAVSIPRVIAAYSRYVDLQDPLLCGFFDIDAALAQSSLASVDGTFIGSFAGIDGFFYLRLPKMGGVYSRLLLLPSFFAFAPDYGASHNTSTNVYDAETLWLSGYALVGAQARWGAGDGATLGGILRVEPMVAGGAVPLFDRDVNVDGRVGATETTSFDRLYADLSISGWRFDTLLSLGSIEQLAAEKLFDIVAGKAGLGPAMEYIGRLSSFRPGLSGYWKPEPWLELSAQAKAAIGGGSLGLGELGLSADLPVTLIKDIRRSGKDMTLRGSLRASLLDYEGELVPGCKAELALENYPFLTYFDLLGLRYLGRLAAGISWNYSDSLLRMPFKDQAHIYLLMGGSYYSGGSRTSK